ncbi:hypothetical protein TAMA11512_00570 [Selenomonas sp. TAMA-11512]|uniref:hypothetical protein n=1 Tax=Selenomonas sp. TAMA-11512 TaxID=3095337 RepID=UPI00308C0C23|nr:hypothetical protein TAMA11512_00570 [Selenomonas sp. TAMA-11512]
MLYKLQIPIPSLFYGAAFLREIHVVGRSTDQDSDQDTDQDIDRQAEQPAPKI